MDEAGQALMPEPSTGKASRPKGKRAPGRKTHVPRFPELPPKYSSSRELRNKAEKLRRERLNKLIEEMKQLVPVISSRTKKSDTTRTNILRLSANYLRLQQLFPYTNGKIFPAIANLARGIDSIQALSGAVMLLSENGRILYISEQITQYSGYSQLDLLGMSLYHFVHPGDHLTLKESLTRRVNHANPASTSSLVHIHTSPPKETLSRQSFYLRLRVKPANKGEQGTYEHVHVLGHYRESKEAERSLSKDLEYVFIAVLKPVMDRPFGDLSLMEAVQDQYLTRHMPDGRITHADQRISTLAGYLPSDVQGKSAFNFMLGDDLPWATMALRNMFDNANGEGETTYRLRTKTGEYICLITRGFIEYNKKTNQIESFVCVNTMIKESDSEKVLEEQRKRFAPYIAELQMAALTNSSKDVWGGDIEEEADGGSLRHSPNKAIRQLKRRSADTGLESSPRKHFRSSPAAAAGTPAAGTSAAGTSAALTMDDFPADLGGLLQEENGYHDLVDTIASLVLPMQYKTRDSPLHRLEKGTRILERQVNHCDRTINSRTSAFSLERTGQPRESNLPEPNPNINHNDGLEKIAAGENSKLFHLRTGVEEDKLLLNGAMQPKQNVSSASLQMRQLPDSEPSSGQPQTLSSFEGQHISDHDASSNSYLYESVHTGDCGGDLWLQLDLDSLDLPPQEEYHNLGNDNSQKSQPQLLLPEATQQQSQPQYQQQLVPAATRIHSVIQRGPRSLRLKDAELTDTSIFHLQNLGGEDPCPTFFSPA